MLTWEEVFTVQVKIDKSAELQNNDGDTVIMISFTGQVKGDLFQGKVLDGGVDTQIISKSGSHSLSARYMLHGQDYTGETCQIYIENNGNFHKNEKESLFQTYPKLITNSKALSYLNNEVFVAEGFPTEIGVDIKIYRWV